MQVQLNIEHSNMNILSECILGVKRTACILEESKKRGMRLFFHELQGL